jgi:transcriptional regulator with XRE-family HTH domain
MAATHELLGKRIRALRKQKGMSQEQLAEQVGMSGKYLGEIERGQVNCSAI